MKICLKSEHLLVKEVLEKEKVVNGIIFQPSYQVNSKKVEIIKTGSSDWECMIGGIHVINADKGTYVELGGEVYIIIEEEDLLAKIGESNNGKTN